MKAKREAQPPRTGDRRRGQNNASPGTGRRATRLAIRTADHAGRPPRRAAGSCEERHPGQGAS